MAATNEDLIVPENSENQEAMKPSEKDKTGWEEELYHKLLQTGSIKGAALIGDDGMVKVANFAVDPQGEFGF